MISVGSFVKFSWWSDYRAASATPNEEGHTTWHEVHPGDKGVVMCKHDDDNFIVLFSGVDTLLRVNGAMLSLI